MYMILKNFDNVVHVHVTGLKTHGGPGAIGPQIFQMAPRFLRTGAQRAPKPSAYIYMFGPTDFGLGPLVYESGCPKGPEKKSSFVPWCKSSYIRTNKGFLQDYFV